MSNNENLYGLKGWLILIGIGLVLSPINSLIIGSEMLIQLIEGETWGAMTSVNSNTYTPFWGELVIGEFVFELLMLIASIYLAYLFFTKNFFFPKYFIIFSVVSLIAIPLDAWLITKVLPHISLLREEVIFELIRTSIVCSIWIPYMLVSKRVKATFVKNMPNKEMQPTAERVS